LNRPPTLLTISSSRSSGIMGCSEAMKDTAGLFDGLLEILVDNFVLINIRKSQFALGHFQPPRERFFCFGLPPAKPLLQVGDGVRLHEDRNRLGVALFDLAGAL